MQNRLVIEPALRALLRDGQCCLTGRLEHDRPWRFRYTVGQFVWVTLCHTEPLTLLPLASQSFDVQLTALNQPIVFGTPLSREDDPSDVVHRLAQTPVPGRKL